MRGGCSRDRQIFVTPAKAGAQCLFALLLGFSSLAISSAERFVLLRRASYFSFACPKEK
jgi:hypothetical protein